MGCRSGKPPAVTPPIEQETKLEIKPKDEDLPQTEVKPVTVFKPVDIFDVLNGDVAAPDQPPPPNISPGEYKNTNKPAGKVRYVPEEPGEALLKIEDTFWVEKRRVLPDLQAMKAIEEHALKASYFPIVKFFLIMTYKSAHRSTILLNSLFHEFILLF